MWFKSNHGNNSSFWPKALRCNYLLSGMKMKRGSRGDRQRTGPLQTGTSCEWEQKELGGWCRNSLEALGDSRGQLPVFSRAAAPFLHQDHLHRWCSCTNSAWPWVACSLHFIWDIGGLWVFAHLFSFRDAPVLRFRRQRAENRGLLFSKNFIGS